MDESISRFTHKVFKKTLSSEGQKMKAFGIFLIMLAIAGVSVAQDPSGSETPPDVVVLKFGVKMRSNSESSWASRPSLPSSGSTSGRDAGVGGARNNPTLSREDREILNREQQADIERSRREGSTKSSSKPAAQSEMVFVYSISIKNTGNTTINAIEWMVVVSETGSSSSNRPWEHSVYIKKEISPGKTRELSSVSPVGHYSVLAKPDKNNKTTIAAVIKRIEYSDGRIWERASVTK